jgi:uncharacterized protein (TIGR02147 family)
MKVNEQTKIQQLLKKRFLEIQSRTPSFSIRSFAEQLGMQPGATNEIIKGQRRVSRKIAERIADKLALDPSERAALLTDFPSKLKRNTKAKKQTSEKNEIHKMNMDQFALISDWVYFAILSLIQIKDFSSEISWISQRLGVSELDTRRAIIRLQSLKLIHIDNKGTISRTAQPIRTSDDIRNQSLQQMHLNDMEIAKEKIQKISVSDRDFTNYTFPANPQSLNRAKEILRQAQDDLESLMNDKDAREVYRVCMYLFPLTQLEKHG